jgi:DNA-binding SARP family transcriptional activator
VATPATLTEDAPGLAREMSVSRPSAPPCPITLHLLDTFRLTVDAEPVELTHPAQRLLALLALRHRPLLRGYVAGALWLDHSEGRAAANLRSLLWRLRSRGLPLVTLGNGTIELARAVQVDLHEAVGLAQRWLAGTETEADRATGSAALEGEILPEWYDEWASDDRERFRQLRLHALEAMAERLGAGGRWADAMLAALAVVAADPLRESAHRAVIKVHLAEGNVGEAIRQLRRCERVMIEEVGVPPSAQLQELIPALR